MSTYNELSRFQKVPETSAGSGHRLDTPTTIFTVNPSKVLSETIYGYSINTLFMFESSPIRKLKKDNDGVTSMVRMRSPIQFVCNFSPNRHLVTH